MAADTATQARPFGERAPGTGIPRVIALGTWRKRGGQKGFAAVYRGKPGVVVCLRDSEFAWLCVGVDVTQYAAARISAVRDAP